MTILDCGIDPSPHICPNCTEDLGSPRCCGRPHLHPFPAGVDERAQGWLATYAGPAQGWLEVYAREVPTC